MCALPDVVVIVPFHEEVQQVPFRVQRETVFLGIVRLRFVHGVKVAILNYLHHF